MHSDATVEAVRAFVGLVAVVGFVVLVARRVGVPDELGLLAAGLLAAVAVPTGIVVTPEIVLLVLLPGLVFEASYRLKFAEFRGALWAIALLAVPGVLVTAGIVALVLHSVAGLSVSEALIVGAIVSATDPASVIAAFTKLGAPSRLSTLVQGESLLNDGTGLVLFAFALRLAQSAASVSAGLLSIAVAIVGSLVLGLVLALVASRVVATIDDFLVEITLSIALAYGAYALADAWGLSGIIATVVAGITFGNYGSRVGMTERTRNAVDVVWSVAAFVLTALVFLLMGIAIKLDTLAPALVTILWGMLAVLGARAVVIYVLVGSIAHGLHVLGREGIPMRWRHVMFWSGLRGAVAVAMALSLPLELPDREVLQQAAFGIVLATILVQGTTTPVVVRWALGSRPQV